ncbi:uncharacterized protein LOC118193270 [Stegodyphus dumicola]|uniref:uncharacterized protein LOC118193270 n=1 Tax=Stegodyphus dumicola TaxID=202533 RepID=UPI0015B2F1A0|nr:uncharacterized protein LOC118193270 [Stegodyphus dumicola]
MDVSEIPLSAKIKQELDDIFEVPMQTEAADVQITETVLGRSSRKTKKTGLKNRSEDPDMVEIHSDEECQADENPPPVVFSKGVNPPKKEKDYTVIGDNKPFESMVSANAEPELPRNLMKIQIVSLICKKKLSVFLQQNQKTGVKNFKKFKKVHPVKAQVLPRIIGSHELVPYDKNSLRVSNIDWDEPQQDEVFQPVKGEFDWETPVN